MKIEQKAWTRGAGWSDVALQSFPEPPQLVLAFGARDLMEDPARFADIRAFYPQSHVIECSTAGEILNTRVQQDSIALAASFFEKTNLRFAQTGLAESGGSFGAGRALASALPREGLVHVLVFSDGLRVDGEALLDGLHANLPTQVAITGGLAGDDADFRKTVVGFDDVAREDGVVAVGFYGDAFRVGYGACGGLDVLSIERTITRSKGNVVYELDGKPALELYRTYLGNRSRGLPWGGLLFPLRLRLNGDRNTDMVRRLIDVNESERSMTFGGSMPEGAQVAMLKANTERMIDGAADAGATSMKMLEAAPPELALLVSCIGRKLILGTRTEEEVRAVRSVLGEKAAAIGFYSYAQLCSSVPAKTHFGLHNQTMSVTTFREDWRR